jgi:cobyric acid synthase CobQ/L-threonine-O-3-phosphate decarboxylase
MSGHGGNIGQLARKLGCAVEEILDFSANINPLGPPEYLWDVLARNLPDIVHYPDPGARQLTRALATAYNLASETIITGNGTSELLFAAVRALAPGRAVIVEPAYIDYRQACEQAHIPVHTFLVKSASDFQPDLARLDAELQPGDLVILGRPNNPTGVLVERQELLALVHRHPEVLFLIDEAFAGFVPGSVSVAGETENLVVLCSLTKLFAVPGLRLGFLSAAPGLCRKIRGLLAPWSVNNLAQSAGIAVAGDWKFIEQTQEIVQENRCRLVEELHALSGLRVFPSQANFLLLRLENGLQAPVLADRLLRRHRIAVRPCDNYIGLDERYVRVAVRSRKDNQQLVEALVEVLSPARSQGKKARPKSRAASLMLLGTGSDVGKSVLVAGLCRVLLQDGVRVAPFKAQNMSLNSYVTRDGGEMGRAQVVQAQACRLDPDVRMNPVLLKPSSDVGSQIIVNGRPVGNMKVMDYVRYKKEAWQEVCRAYDALAADFDCIILEGAGSPGEVNLKAHDIVNMPMARYADAPSLLVGDIDRGGVYASFIGHVEVMLPWERRLLAGFVVNRFRGDASLLGDAHDFIRQRTGRPVLGVVPFQDDLGLPQEDSVSFKAGLYDSTPPDAEHVDIALIDLPHISNFTDVEPLLEEPDVHVRIVRRPDELGNPDCIILPGSKNVAADLAALKKSGMDRAVTRFAEQGCTVVGICGGFQMLGRSLSDPLGLEGEAGMIMDGLALLPVDTELAGEKTLTRRQGTHLQSGREVHGYEIHHGRSSGSPEAMLRFDDGSGCGCATDDGRIWGSYLHGIFDADGFRRWFINDLRRTRGLAAFKGQGACYDLEPALDRLADVLRESLDMDAIHRLLDL